MDDDLIDSTEAAAIAGLKDDKGWNRAVSRDAALKDAKVYIDRRTVRWPRKVVEAWRDARPGKGNRTPRKPKAGA